MRLPIKNLDRFLLKTYLRPFLGSFLVMVFFLLMQLLWKFVDDLVGRGVEWYYIAELMFYWSAAVVPMALPLAVLLSSLMTFGALGENNELAALKASGISLYRIIRPIVAFIGVLSIGAFLFYNYVIPVANLKGESLLLNISRQKPALNIRQGVFYGGIEGYSIKIGEKYGPDNNLLRNILIYDHRDQNGNTKVIVAESGAMYTTDNELYLVLELENGKSYEDQIPAKRQDRDRMPFVVNAFEKATIKFSLSDFQTGDLREERRKDYNMLNVVQLLEAADTLKMEYDKRNNDIVSNLRDRYFFHQHTKDTIKVDSLIPIDYLSRVDYPSALRAVQNGVRIARLNKEQISTVGLEFTWRKRVIARHYIEYHKKFALSAIVLILFFIGAPLGAIIRKGGMGVPVVVSVIIFIIYHVLNISIEKLGRELVITPMEGIWLPPLILFPFALLITRQAANDSGILQAEFYKQLGMRLKAFFTKKK